jgi:hypothetical protein
MRVDRTIRFDQTTLRQANLAAVWAGMSVNEFVVCAVTAALDTMAERDSWLASGFRAVASEPAPEQVRELA